MKPLTLQKDDFSQFSLISIIDHFFYLYICRNFIYGFVCSLASLIIYRDVLIVIIFLD